MRIPCFVAASPPQFAPHSGGLSLMFRRYLPIQSVFPPRIRGKSYSTRTRISHPAKSTGPLKYRPHRGGTIPNRTSHCPNSPPHGNDFSPVSTRGRSFEPLRDTRCLWEFRIALWSAIAEVLAPIPGEMEQGVGTCVRDQLSVPESLTARIPESLAGSVSARPCLFSRAEGPRADSANMGKSCTTRRSSGTSG